MPTDETRRRILEAATEAFARHGFKKTSIDDVAKAAGVGKGTVYLVCDSKEDLFYQVVHRELRLWVAEVSTLIDPRKPAEELLAQCSFQALAYLETRPLVRDLILGNLVEVLPLWTDRLAELRLLGRQNTVELLRLGIRQGRFRPDLDIEAVARLLQDIQAAGMVMAFREKRTPEEQLEGARVGLDVVLRGLLLR
jgi:AcrR family transcriptional regulator